VTTAEERFEALFVANYGDVLAYTVRRCPSRQDAEDVVAETFTVAWRRIADIPQGDRARLWLFGTAHRVLLNQERARRRQQSLAERMRVVLHTMRNRGTETEPSEGAEIRHALAALTTTDREVLQLHVWEALSADEIAVALDITTPAVWKRLQRARQRLSKALEPEPGDDAAPLLAVVPTLREEAR
jgi:RNA polymerase sigma-70 factor (ECF subfamily)